MWEIVCHTVNNVGTMATYKKTASGVADISKIDAEYGICAGMSAIWLKNMFVGRDIDAGNMITASILYSKWKSRWKSRPSAEIWNQWLVENAGLSQVAAHSWSSTEAVLQMKNFGSYYISTGNHALAVVARDGGFYFFDPNVGARRTDSATDFDDVKRLIEQYSSPLYKGYKPTWVVLTVVNA
jgi:hypothetical protein